MFPVQVEIQRGRKREAYENLFDIPAIIGIGSSDSWAASSVGPDGQVHIPFDPVYCYSLADVENWFGIKIEGDELKGFSGSNFSIYNSAQKIWGEGGELSRIPILCVQVEGDELSPENVASAFDSIESLPLSCVLIANYFEDELGLIAKMEEFVNNRGDCFGIYMLRFGQTTTTYTSDGLVAVAQKRQNAETDVAAHFLGGILRRKPWEGGNYQSLSKFDFDNFTTQEMRELHQNQINFPLRLHDGSIWMSENFVLGSLKYLDLKRTLDFASFRLKTYLTSEEILGNVKINRQGLNSLRERILSSLEILSDATNSIEVQIPVLDALLSGDNETVQYYQNTREIDVNLFLEIERIIHQLKINLTIT